MSTESEKDNKKHDFDEKKVYKWIFIFFFILVFTLLVFYGYYFPSEK